MGFLAARRERRAERAAASETAQRQAHAASHDGAIADFWRWWHDGGAAETTRVFDGPRDDPRGLQAVGEHLGELAQQLGLGFETGRGRRARHVLVLTPEGDAAAAVVADRWLAAAPAPDDAFEFDSRRRAADVPGDVVIEMNDHAFDLASVTMLARPDGERVHVALWHPGFARVERSVAGTAAFLLLDALLGERAVEERVGAIRFDLDPGDGGRPFAELREMLG